MPTKPAEALPTYERILFPAAHLEIALVQVKFPPLPRFDEEGYLNNFKEALSAAYPLQTVERAMNVIAGPQGVSQIQGGLVHRSSSLDHLWSVTLTVDAITLECRAYSEIGDFAARFCSILEHVSETLKPRHQLRFGLRYVNEFRSEKAQTYEGWLDVGLNPELLGIGARNVFGGNVTQTISEFRTNRPNGSLLIRHGFLEGTTVAPSPGKKMKMGSFYLLDLDYFDESPGDFTAHPVDRMIIYNDYLYRVFRWCIGDGALFRDLQQST